jgi:hypothetical protein
VITRRVRFTKTAQGHLQEAKLWWRENRDDPNILVDDIEEAIFVIARLPRVGSTYALARSPGVRRIYLRRIGAHLYYTFSDEEVLVRAFWHAKRGSGPQLGR